MFYSDRSIDIRSIYRYCRGIRSCGCCTGQVGVPAVPEHGVGCEEWGDASKSCFLTQIPLRGFDSKWSVIFQSDLSGNRLSPGAVPSSFILFESGEGYFFKRISSPELLPS